MPLVYFGASIRLPTAGYLSLVLLAAGLTAAVAVVLYRELNDRISLDLLMASSAGKFWALAGLSALGFFSWQASAALRWGKFYGLRVWPLSLGSSLGYSLKLAALGALAFWVAAKEGLAGDFESWRPRWSPRHWLRLCSAGAATGLGAALAGMYAQRWLFLADALSRLGHAAPYIVLLVLQPIGLAATVWAAAALALAREWPRATRLRYAAYLLAVWCVPNHGLDFCLRKAFDYGQADLAQAAGIPRASKAPALGVLVLSRRDGSRGDQYREQALALEGLDVTPSSLRKLRRYLESRGYRSLFLTEALGALRSGWMLNWEPVEHLRAAMEAQGPGAEPDFLGFLQAMRIAPITAQNFKRLESMSGVALQASFPRVDRAQRTYEGFSAAYAHFGDTEGSNAWLGKVANLWPLYSEDIHIEPIEKHHDGSISGRVLFKKSAQLKIGLFVQFSTKTVLAAYDGLVDAERLGRDGRFAFSHLVPGRYYLALQADSALLGGGRLRVRGAPGLIRLTSLKRRVELPPIVLSR